MGLSLSPSRPTLPLPRYGLILGTEAAQSLENLSQILPGSQSSWWLSISPGPYKVSKPRPALTSLRLLTPHLLHCSHTGLLVIPQTRQACPTRACAPAVPSLGMLFPIHLGAPLPHRLPGFAPMSPSEQDSSPPTTSLSCKGIPRAALSHSQLFTFVHFSQLGSFSFLDTILPCLAGRLLTMAPTPRSKLPRPCPTGGARRRGAPQSWGMKKR